MILLPVNEAGEIEGLTAEQLSQVDPMITSISEQMVAFYADVGFAEPWIAYVSIHMGEVVGGGAFKSPPADGRVEIAYYTIPGYENQGMATATAQALIDLAVQTDEELTVVAQTLPEKNASNHVLQKLGFIFDDVVDHPEDGPVWEWHLF